MNIHSAMRSTSSARGLTVVRQSASGGDKRDLILKAATKPTRDLRVGMMSKVNTFAAKNLPGVADRMAAKQVENLQRDEPPRAPDGTLYHPGESGHVHGDHAQAT